MQGCDDGTDVDDAADDVGGDDEVEDGDELSWCQWDKPGCDVGEDLVEDVNAHDDVNVEEGGDNKKCSQSWGKHLLCFD